MKKYLLSFLSVMLLSSVAISQPAARETTNTGSDKRPKEPAAQRVAGPAADAPYLQRFDLDFPGGTPQDLVRAIVKAKGGKPVNAVIPEAHADLKLPPLSMRNVNISQLFSALNRSSVRQEIFITGTSFGGSGEKRHLYQTATSAYGFRTEGPPDEDSIWYFFYEKPPVSPDALSRPPDACRFYQLAPYLAAGYKVEDITTAVETGWKMLGETDLPRISYHKDTKLLIAVGEEGRLSLIDQALSRLQTEKPTGGQNAEKPKAQ